MGVNGDVMQKGLQDVRDMIVATLRETSLGPMIGELRELIASGKMLRARFALYMGHHAGANYTTLLHASAAIELIHAASLLHDDVIDGATLRRGASSFWAQRGTSGAILLGDLLYCRAIATIEAAEGGILTPVLAQKAGEMCDAECEQELLLRGVAPSWETCVSIARRKTGSLFAFVGYAAGGSDLALSRALEEAAYKIGTAYQIADDLLDVSGQEAASGKTLGTDRARHKLTAASCVTKGGPDPKSFIADQCREASELLQPWPSIRAAWDAMIARELQPALDTFTANFRASEYAR